MKRELVSAEDIVTLMTAKLREYEECKDAKMLGVMASEPDETGCNWSYTEGIRFNPGSGAQEEVGPIAVSVYDWARARYNLA